ncbi:hypothetical protein NP493_355g01020 [Ridgeia piscesae]|uniref:C-type lectin domain-containing protein n=1 Tax=Ridgeia piscesae TaxID=27915 RepID=A0AAD9NTM6_RIDPI|nr:hypothetical protein NP493_355g01020 [Ridgeia piscesae]
MLPPGCPPGYVRHFMSCYMFANTTANWVDAEKICQRTHPLSHLVAMETQDEEEFIIKYRNYNSAYWSSAYLWTGANDMAQEGRWTWVGTGKPLGYTNWRPNEPNNHNLNQHCIYFGASAHSHGWDDWHCYAARLNFVCEITLMA